MARNMKPIFKKGDIVLIRCTGEVVTLMHFWQGLIDGFWMTSQGFYLVDYTFEHASPALKVLYGAKLYENIESE